MSNSEVLYLLARERSLEPAQRLIVFAALQTPELMAMSCEQLAKELNIAVHTVRKAMPIFKANRMVKRDLRSKGLILTDPSTWALKPR